jgi:hypothetical protein
VPPFGLIFPRPIAGMPPVPSAFWWISGLSMGVGVTVALALDATLAHPGPWPSTAVVTITGLGGVAAWVYMARIAQRWRREHPEEFPVLERAAPALPAGMRLVAGTLAGILIAAALAAGVLVGTSHPRLAGAVAIGILVLAIPGFAAAAWWSIRSERSPRS